jgi:hypothetical protein
MHQETLLQQPHGQQKDRIRFLRYGPAVQLSFRIQLFISFWTTWNHALPSSGRRYRK